jgi:hypothetical protein
MRVPFAVCVLGLALLSSGCALLCDGAGMVLYRTRQALDDCREWMRDKRLAAAAWDEVRKTESGRAYSEDHAAGFRDGFADYLYEGGTGEPPLVPPASYRTPRYQTAEGYQAVQEWFAGYRHGAAAARQSGLRRWLTSPSSLTPVGGPPPAPALPVGPILAEPARELPAPRPVHLLPPTGGDAPASGQGELFPPPSGPPAASPVRLLAPVEETSSAPAEGVLPAADRQGLPLPATAVPGDGPAPPE